MKSKLKLTDKQKKIVEACTMIAAGIGVIIAIFFASCTATRIVTTRAEYVQRGDTTLIIQTKTNETYNAKKQ